jgi:hypothetical protein
MTTPSTSVLSPARPVPTPPQPVAASTSDVSATSAAPETASTADAAVSKPAPLPHVRSTATGPGARAAGTKSAAPIDYDAFGGRK